MRGERRQADRAQRRGEPLALLDHRPSRRAATRAPRPRARRRGVETGAGAWRAFSSAATSRDGERVADARAGERRTPSRTCAARSPPSSSSGIAVSPQYSKYASSTTSGRASGSGRSSPSRAVRPAGEREHRVVVADLGARELRGDAVERIGRRRRDRDRVARARRSSARRAGSGRRRRRRARPARARRRCSRRSRAGARGSRRAGSC